MPERISHIERIAHAKINLALHVTGKREDGYHLLDSLVVFSNFGDKISISEAINPSSLVSLKIDGPFAVGLESGANNLVSRATLSLGYEITKYRGKPTPVDIRLTKNLPIASGIGGGSADAAATLLALNEFWDSEIDLMPIAKTLGADIPMCLHSKPLRAQGIGDEVTLLEAKHPLHMILVNPNLEVPTPAIFKHLADKQNAPMFEKAISTMPPICDLKNLRNDLQKPAIEIEPAIEAVLADIAETNAQLVRMSGSGATCFGLYETLPEAQKAAKIIKTQNPDWWCVATSTTVS
jgi:4-diphosphocytidyl-2-C-methyl-D-erythritol kinase